MWLFGGKSKGEPFENKDFEYGRVNDSPKYDLVTIYEKCIEEMTLQQSKRDQIITVYLAMFSFVVSYILSSSQFDFFTKGLIFFATAVVGLGFSLIIIRYRMYKEAYWICCQAITNLMSFKEGTLDKKTIQAVYYRCLEKKGDTYIIKNRKKKRFNKLKFFWKNIFSGETIYCLIHAFIVSVLLGLSVCLIIYTAPYDGIRSGAMAGIIAFIFQVHIYFENLIEIYSVLVDGTKDSFNKAFSKAWFLHLYVEKGKGKNDKQEEL